MADIFGAFARGHEQGDALGGRMAARGIRRRVEQAEADFRANKINEDQYEQALRDAQGRGMARFRDTSDVVNHLRTQAFDYRNRRDDRGAAQAAIDGNFGGVADYTGQRAVRMGDLSGAAASRDLTEGVRRGGLVKQLPTGEMNYVPAFQQQERDMLARGSLAGGQEASEQARSAMAGMTSRMANEAINARDFGDMDAFVAHVNAVAELRGLPFQVQVDAEGRVYTADGAKEIDGSALNNLLYQLADGNDTQLIRTLQREAETAEAARAFELDVTKSGIDAAREIVKDLNLPADSLPHVQSVASATARMTARGAKNISALPSGIVVMQIGDQLIEVRPAPEPTSDDPDAVVDNRPSYFLAGTNEQVDPNDIDDDIEAGAADILLAQRAVGAQGDFDRVVELLNMKLAANDAITQGALGRPGPGPVLTALMQTSNKISEARAAPAVDAFMGVVEILEGDGQNPLSSAVGTGQFIDGTLIRAAKEFAPDNPVSQQVAEAARLSGAERRAALTAIKSNPDNREYLLGLTQALAADHARMLARDRIAVNPLSLYVMHHFGATTGREFMHKLAANPNTPVGDVFSAGEFAANPYLRNKGTLAGVVAHWANNAPALLDGMPENTVAQLTGAAAPAPQGGGQRGAQEGVAPSAAQRAPISPADPLQVVTQITEAARRGEAAQEAVRVLDRQIATLTSPLARREAAAAAPQGTPRWRQFDIVTGLPKLSEADAALLKELREQRAQYAALAQREQRAAHQEDVRQRVQSRRDEARSALSNFPAAGLAPSPGAE